MYKFCFIGVGKMGSALLGGYLKQKTRTGAICAYDKYTPAAEAFEEHGVSVAASATEAARDSEIIFLCAKPQDLDELLTEIGRELSGKILVSIAAGVKIATICALAPEARAVVRAMPNLPALIGLGATAIAFGDCPEQAKHLIGEVFLSVGDFYTVEEEQMDTVTALSGSGPAYFYRVAKALAGAAAKLGLDYELAVELCAQTMSGAAGMMKASGKKPEQLIADVASPGGTTQAALDVFDEIGLDKALEEGLYAAFRRGRELGGDKNR